MKRVQDIMTRDVRACNPGTNLAVAAGIMWEYDCGVLPVIENEGRMVGIITDRDICMAVATRGRLASDITVGEVMSKEIFSCKTDDDIKDALKLMREVRVHRLPVLKKGNGKLEGILSLNDVVLNSGEERGREIPEISYRDVALTLKAISQHPFPKELEKNTFAVSSTSI